VSRNLLSLGLDRLRYRNDSMTESPALITGRGACPTSSTSRSFVTDTVRSPGLTSPCRVSIVLKAEAVSESDLRHGTVAMNSAVLNHSGNC
jgi:hypothetical protein